MLYISIIKHPRSRLRSAFVRILLSLLTLTWFVAPRAHAQVDTAAARDARSALRAVQQAYGSQAEWQKRFDALALPDVEHELCAGGRAESKSLEAAVSMLRRGATSQFADERFKKLARALERRSEEIVLIPAEEWPAACRREAESYRPVSDERLQTARKYVEKRLVSFEKRLPTERQGDNGWRTLLNWPQSRALVAAPVDKTLPLDDLEMRWRGALATWNAPELIEASLAVQMYIPLLRGYLAPESAEEHAAAWNEIARLLDSRSVASTSDLQRLAELLSARERRGEASALTASIRREFSRPNIVVQAHAAWLEQLLSRHIEERFPVNAVYGGTRSVGSAVMKAEARAQFLPSNSVGQLALRFDGTSRARTVAGSQGVTVHSRATTRVDGTKRIALGAGGLSTRAAVVNANTSISYDSINAPGLRRRREESVRQTYARRPQAETDASAAARRSTAERLDEEGAKLVKNFNQKYRTRLQEWQFSPRGQTADVRMSTAGDTVQWQCCLESPLLFAAPSAPPRFEPSADLLVSLASSAFEEQCLTVFGGRRLSGSEIADAIGEVLGETPQEAPAGLDFTATFAARPCEVSFTGGEAAVRLFITAFDSADVQYPALTVDAQFVVEVQDGALVLVRKGSVRVLPLAAGDGQKPAVSGRQQTLRVAVQRKLNKALPEKITWQPPPFSRPDAKPVALRIERAAADDGWLQIGLNGE